MRKGHLLLLILLIFCCFITSARRRIEMSQGGQMPTHTEHFLPADMPEVYLDSDEMEIIIEADGFASYYNVYISDVPTNTLVISTQISGYGDSIDISSLESCYYLITIVSEYNNVYQGYFTIE